MDRHDAGDRSAEFVGGAFACGEMVVSVRPKWEWGGQRASLLQDDVHPRLPPGVGLPSGSMTSLREIVQGARKVAPRVWRNVAGEVDANLVRIAEGPIRCQRRAE